MVSVLESKPIKMKLSFGKWLKLRRELKKLTQEKVSKELDVTRTTVSNWENDFSKPSLDPDQTNKLCLLLGVSLEDLAKAFNKGITIDE